LRGVGRVYRFLRRLILTLIGLVAMLYLLNYSTIPLGDEWQQVAVIARNQQFDYVGWEIGAIGVKAWQGLYGEQPFMTEAARSAYVRDYMSDLGDVQRIEQQIANIYTNPDIADHAAASADLQAERDERRASLRERQALTEAILEGQVAAVLVRLGFGLGGQLLPPISMHFTQVPNLLVVSPREQIRFDVSINLNAMTADEMDALEREIDQKLDVSSLIVPLGGIALYPAMILETSSIPFTIETFAHEWLHHYLFFYPLGFEYEFANETRIINESTAEAFGREVSRLVLARYYPDLLPPPAPPPAPVSEASSPAAEPPPQDTPPAFDFGREMNETRITVDALLAEGKIDEAEAYMEERRRLFVEHGYGLRKLNTAYFAFYGGYQGSSPGEGGSDPIGPAVRAIREQSATIYDWIKTMRTITTREELLGAIQPSLDG
jgi:hypothetical protein